MSIRHEIKKAEYVELSEDGKEVEVLYKSSQLYGNHYVDIPLVFIDVKLKERIDHAIEAQAEVMDELTKASDTIKNIKEAVPTNWLDPLLTGKDSGIGEPPYSGNDIEVLLRAIKERINKLSDGDTTGT